jgi:long-chain acyl-CoA synthetase
VNLAALLGPHPDGAAALVSRGQTTTYGDLRDQVARLHGGLVERGVAPGDRVALLCANNWFFVTGYLAALAAGAVAVPLNPADVPEALERELRVTSAKVAIVGPAGARAFSQVDRAGLALEHVLVPEGVPIEGAESLEDALRADPLEAVERSVDDLAVLIFTAGTAGSPRAAMLTHGNLLANLEQQQAARPLRPDDVVLGVLPLFHIFGLNVSLGGALRVGASIVLSERFDPKATLDEVRDHGVTIVAGAPTMYVAWANLPGADAASFASVRIAASGAAKLPEEVAAAFATRFGVTISEGYGLTEASPVVTSSVGVTPHPGSVGIPVPGVEVRLVDEDGEDALEGDAGEIWVRGPNVFAGYLDEPEATERALTPGGWLRTGDVAVAGVDGELYIVDRAKDLIIVSGFNVYPGEVEDVLVQHPGVAEAVVVGEPHPYTGEAVRAYVVPEPGRFVEEDELIEFARSHLARYKAPTTVTIRDEIPRNAGGKVLRRLLR